jgi:glycosyltransferase involved in cell wall biosynthesis
MRISLFNVHMIPQDAVGQCVLNQARFFRNRGDDVRIYCMVLPEGAPADAVELTRAVDAAGYRDEHFARSDLYIFHYPGLYSLMDAIKTIDRGIVIFHYHNVTPPELWGSEEELDLLRRSQAAVSTLIPYADLVVTPSAFNADQLVAEHACARERIRVLPLAVPLDRFRPGPCDPALVRRHRLEGRQVILFVGRMAGNKRIDLLLEALALVKRQVPNATLMLVGDDRSNSAFVENVHRLKARARELELGESLLITGKVDDLPPYYRLAAVYASASLHEGFGVPLIEAMASGIPVVASRATAHPWVVQDAGLLVEPGDATDLAAQIVRVLRDNTLRGELVRRGLARASACSLEQYAVNLARIVDEAWAMRPRHRPSGGSRGPYGWIRRLKASWQAKRVGR